VTVDNLSGINSSLKRSSVAGELGLTKDIRQLNLDLSI
jgi:hypothetical protein